MNYGARHDFLRSLHELLRPATYLEIGVQTGRSLRLARPDTSIVGIDPDPQTAPPINGDIYRMTSDDFFAARQREQTGPFGSVPVDLAFIDGMHLVEYALRDFINVERHARPDRRSVAVFDDVLPYSPDIAGRTPLPGDWAGDVWKIFPILDGFRPDLTLILVNVEPTGALVVLDLAPGNADLNALHDGLVTDWAHESTAAETGAALNSMHRYAVGPAAALQQIRTHLHITEA